MKIIDEKGRFLGLINTIDLLVILGVLLVIGGVFYKFKKPSPTKIVKVTFTVIAPAIRPEMLTNVKVGDRMVSSSGFTNVVVKDVKTKPAYMITTDSAGRRVETLDPYLKDLFVTLEGKTDISGSTIKLGDQEIRSNKEYFVKSLDYELKGLIMAVEIDSSS